MTAFLLYPLAVIELVPRFIHHTLHALTHRRST